MNHNPRWLFCTHCKLKFIGVNKTRAATCPECKKTIEKTTRKAIKKILTKKR